MSDKLDEQAFKYSLPTTDEEARNIAGCRKQFRTERMRYRLTEHDYRRIMNDEVPLEEYKCIYYEVDLWMKERKYLRKSLTDLRDFIGSKCGHLNLTADDFYYPIMIAKTNFLKVNYCQIYTILGLEWPTDNNYMRDYHYFPYETLLFLSQIYNGLVDSGIKSPYLSVEDLFKFAHDIGTVANKAFVQRYGVEPIMIERNECDSIRGSELHLHMTRYLMRKGHLTEEGIQKLADDWLTVETGVKRNLCKQKGTFGEMIYGWDVPIEELYRNGPGSI